MLNTGPCDAFGWEISPTDVGVQWTLYGVGKSAVWQASKTWILNIGFENPLSRGVRQSLGTSYQLKYCAINTQMVDHFEILCLRR